MGRSDSASPGLPADAAVSVVWDASRGERPVGARRAGRGCAASGSWMRDAWRTARGCAANGWCAAADRVSVADGPWMRGERPMEARKTARGRLCRLLVQTSVVQDALDSLPMPSAPPREFFACCGTVLQNGNVCARDGCPRGEHHTGEVRGGRCGGAARSGAEAFRDASRHGASRTRRDATRDALTGRARPAGPRHPPAPIRACSRRSARARRSRRGSPGARRR